MCAINRLFVTLLAPSLLNAPTSALKQGTLPSSLAEQGVQDNLIFLPKNWPLYDEFYTWADRFGKVYETGEEELKRMLIWAENHEFINRHNEKKLSYKLGHNEFSDLTNDEFQQRFFLGPYSPGIERPNNVNFNDYDDTTAEGRKLNDIPESIDWREEGAVTEVKTQGACGGCWAFSATGAIEGANFIKNGVLYSLSEQEFIDCDDLNSGCDGGLFDNAFKYLKETGKGLCSETDYPYEGKQSATCTDKDCSEVPGSHVVDYVDLERFSVDSLMEGIAKQPIAITISASSDTFRFYKSGVVQGDCYVKVDHAVLAMGYGTDSGSGVDYFTIKNQWGTSWGEEGYMRVARDSENEEGTCGVLYLGSYPVL